MRIGNTEDNVDEVARWLQLLHPSRRAQFLALLSHELTVSVRVLAYEAKSHTKWLKSVAANLVLCSDEIVKSHIEHAWKHAETVVNRSDPLEPAVAG